MRHRKIKNTELKSKKVKIIIATIVTILLLLVIAIIYIYQFHGNVFGWKASQDTSNDNSTNIIDYGPATDEQIQAGNDMKSGSSSDTPSSPTPITGSDKKNVQLTITAASQNNPFLQIRVLIGAVESTGTCTLTLVNTDNPTITKTASTQALASTSTCKGFDVPISELSIGKWNITINYSSDALIGSVTQDIVIK